MCCDRAVARAGDSRAGASRPLSRGRGGRSAVAGPARRRPVGPSSELLERRPDVIAAERRIATAFNRVHEAKAARLPAIALTTGVSTVSSDLFVLQTVTILSGTSARTFSCRCSEVARSRRRSRSGPPSRSKPSPRMQRSAFEAFGEVENALSRRLPRASATVLTETLADNRRALEVVQNQFKVGGTDLRFVTQRQLALNASQSALVRVQAEQRVQRVNLHLALGGNFGPHPLAPQSP